jgi:hypothetical protein
MYYNFARVHQTLRVTPAMEAGLADRVMTIEGICNLVIPKKPASSVQREKAMILKALNAEWVRKA